MLTCRIPTCTLTRTGEVRALRSALSSTFCSASSRSGALPSTTADVVHSNVISRDRARASGWKRSTTSPASAVTSTGVRAGGSLWTSPST